MSKRWLALLVAALVCTRAAAKTSTISLDVRNAALSDVIFMLAVQSGKDVIADDSIRREHVTLRLRHVTFDQVLGVLAQTHDLAIRRQGHVYLIGMRKITSRHDVSYAPKPSAESRALDAPRVVPLHFSRPSEVLSALKDVLPNGTYTADDRHSAIAVNGNAEVQAAAEAFLRAVDVSSPHVAFGVRVVSLQTDDAQSSVAQRFEGTDLTALPPSSTTSYVFTKSTGTISTHLNELQSTGHARVLASPPLVTSNDHEAQLLIGRTYPLVLDDRKGEQQQVRLVDVGVNLRVTPTIGADRSVIVELHPESRVLEPSASGVPALTSRELDSIVRVREGETIVVVGLVQDIDGQMMAKLPFLGDIPIFGSTLRNRHRPQAENEIVFLITPHIFGAHQGGR